VRAVTQQGRPLVFEWTGAGTPQALPVSWSGTSSGSDSLRFDGAGRAELRLGPGRYRYRLADAHEGTAAVETYSDEWLPRAATVTAQAGTAAVGRERRSARDRPWLLGLAVLALCGEWLARRRLGLR
jgi:hypothetical protein